MVEPCADCSSEAVTVAAATAVDSAATAATVAAVQLKDGVCIGADGDGSDCADDGLN